MATSTESLEESCGTIDVPDKKVKDELKKFQSYASSSGRMSVLLERETSLIKHSTRWPCCRFP